MPLKLSGKLNLENLISLLVLLLGYVSIFIGLKGREVPVSWIWLCVWFSSMVDEFYADKLKSSVLDLWLLLFLLGLFNFSFDGRYKIADFLISIKGALWFVVVVVVWATLILRRFLVISWRNSFIDWVYVSLKLFLCFYLVSMPMVGLKVLSLSLVVIVIVVLSLCLNIYWMVRKENFISWIEISALYLLTFLMGLFLKFIK